jgi:hypothetical protein
MQQVVRIIDPNFSKQMEVVHSRDGKRLISLMRVKGVDKEIRDQMRVYLATREAIFKKTSMHKEITRHGHPSIAAAFGSETLGVYNPDTIPVDTYLRMKMDPQVAIGLAMIKMPIYSLEWTVKCRDADIKAFVVEALSLVWKRLIRSMLTAIDFGFASHEKVWELMELEVISSSPEGKKKTHFRGKAEIYKKIKAHYPSTVRIRTDSKTDEFLGINQQAGIGGQIVKLDAPKCFFFTLGDEFGNYYGQSRLKPAYKSWYWKEVLTQFMLRYFERRGSPATVVTHPIGGGLDVDGNQYDNSEIALRIGQNLIENSSVTLPWESDREGRNKWGVEFLTDDRRGEMFVNALNYLGAQILRALLTPERVMTQDLSTGSFSMASSHAEIFLLSLEGLAAEIEDAINSDIIPPLIEFNFKPNKIIPCYVKIGKIQYDRKRILKEILVAMINNINTMVKAGKTPNVVPSLIEMSEVLGVPLKVFEEEYKDTGLPSEKDSEGVEETDEGKKENARKGPTKGEPIKKTPVKITKKQPLKVAK